jgi:probable HAF family extracellular repeat protein
MHRDSFQPWTRRYRLLPRARRGGPLTPPWCGLLLAVLWALGMRPAAAQLYSVTDLGTLGGSSIDAKGINAKGQVVGYGTTADGTQRAFLYEGGVMRDLGTLGGTLSSAWGINDAGQIVGGSPLTPSAYSNAFLTTGGVMTNLGTLGGGRGSGATAINALGQIVGASSLSSSPASHAFFYAGGVMRDLGTLPGYPNSRALDLNDAGQIVGESYTVDYAGDKPERACLWQNGGMTDLGTLGGGFSQATAINNAGQVVGGAKTAGDPYHAFLWQNGVMTDLGSLGGSYSNALDINSGGQVVGVSVTPRAVEHSTHAFLYSNGEMLDLNDLIPAGAGWELTQAAAINFSGQIVGEAFQGGERRAVLLTPVPAPRVTLEPSGGLNLGNLPVGSTSAAKMITLTNIGNGPLVIAEQKLQLNGENPGDFLVTPDLTGTTVAPGQSRTLTVRLAPHSGGGQIATLTFVTNALHSPHTLTLGGNGIPRLLNVSSGSLNFGDQRVGTDSAGRSVTLWNVGEIPLTIGSVKLAGANPDDFAIAADGGTGATFRQNEGGTIRVLFSPKVPGNRTATLTITSDAQGSPHTLALSGHGTAPVVRFSPGSLDFGSQLVGSTNGSQAIVLQNGGDAPLTISRVTLTGAQAGDFSITADGWTGVQLLPGQIATLNVGFTPGAAGRRGASLSISDDAEGLPQLVPLAGSGTAPAVRLSAGSLTFGAQLVGTTSGEQTLTLLNTGTAPLTLHGISLAGDHARDFVVPGDLAGVTVAPGQSRSVSVRFSPTAAGSRRATLAISDSAEGSPQLVTLSGTATAPSLTLGISQLGSPSSVSFGSQALGAAGTTQSLTITNSGTAPLTLTGMTLAGAFPGDFALVEGFGAGSLAPGQSRTLTLRFTPLGNGSRAASLVITSNAPGSPTTLALTGAGVLPSSGPGGRELIPTAVELTVAAVEGTPNGTKRAVVAVGQSITLKLRVKFKNGAVADVSTDANVRFLLNAPRGQFAAKNVWQPKAADAGKTLVLYGRYYSPFSRQPFVDQVTVVVLPTRRGR